METTLKDRISILPKVLLLVLTFLMPLKFGSTVGIPEMPMSYWTEPLSILVASWPVMLFPAFSGVVLALCILCLPKPRGRNVNLRLYAMLWGILAATSFVGWIHATTWDFAVQNTLHCFGLASYVFALCLTVEYDPSFVRSLFAAVIVGLVFSIWSALNQYFSGFEDTLKYIREKETKTGVSILEGQFGTRLRESRVAGDFTVCNSYAGYLVLVFPLLIGALWKIGGTVTPPLPAKLILALPAAGLFLFLVKETGSRGAVLSLLAGVAFVVFALKLPRKVKLFLYALLPVGGIAFGLLVYFWRGFHSMMFRLDYFQASLKMMVLHPFAGVGWGEFFNDYLLLKNLVNDEAPHSPHNFVLTLGSQCGIFAFLMASAVLLFPLAAAVYRFSGSGKDDPNRPLKAGLLFGLGAWTFHSMLELNYETPASVGLAALLGVLVLSVPTGIPWTVRIPERFSAGKISTAVFLLAASAVSAAALLMSPRVASAEMNYDLLYTSTDRRFAPDPSKPPPDIQTVKDMLSRCEKRSPFPYAAASAYLFQQGPYYVDEGLALLDEAIRLSPKRSAFYYRKYRILQLLPGRAAEAERNLEKARTLSPKNPQYYPDGVTPFGTRTY